MRAISRQMETVRRPENAWKMSGKVEERIRQILRYAFLKRYKFSFAFNRLFFYKRMCDVQVLIYHLFTHTSILDKKL